MNKAVSAAQRILPGINENTRTVIVAKIDFNGNAEVSMAGEDIDLPWLRDLISNKIFEIMNLRQIKVPSKSYKRDDNEPSNDKN